MARDIPTDFYELLSFFEEYSLKESIQDEGFISAIKPVHKSYFSFLSFVYGMCFINDEKIAIQIIDRMKESSSDLGTVIFLLANGAYKPANLMARSAIENFMKSFAFMVDEKSLDEKSLFNLIDTAGKFSMFSERDLKIKFDELKGFYAVLCSHVHTATIQEMAHISALNTLPTFNNAKCLALSNTIVKSVNAMIYIYIWVFRDEFFCLPEPHRANILSVMTKPQRRLIHEGRT